MSFKKHLVRDERYGDAGGPPLLDMRNEQALTTNVLLREALKRLLPEGSKSELTAPYRSALLKYIGELEEQVEDALKANSLETDSAEAEPDLSTVRRSHPERDADMRDESNMQ